MSFYIRDPETGQFAGSTSAGPAARTFLSFFQELTERPTSLGGYMMVRQPDSTIVKVFVQGGHVNFPD